MGANFPLWFLKFAGVKVVLTGAELKIKKARIVLGLISSVLSQQ
jgi:hypothetical protein